MAVSSLTRRKVKPLNNCAACDYFLHSRLVPSSHNFSILARESKMYLLEIKKRLLIIKDKVSVNININYPALYLLDKVFLRV